MNLIKNIPQASEPKAHIHSSDKNQNTTTANSTSKAPQNEDSVFIHTCGSSHHHATSSNPNTIRKISPWPMITVDEALNIVLEQITPFPVVIIPTSESLGRIVGEDIKAKDPLPPFRASIKDGYAVKAEASTSFFF